MPKLNINNGGVDTNKKMADIDERFGPYSSIESADAALGGQGRNTITAGLTVGILTANAGVKEYWYQPNENSGILELVEKKGEKGDKGDKGDPIAIAMELDDTDIAGVGTPSATIEEVTPAPEGYDQQFKITVANLKGEQGKSAYEVWKEIDGNQDKTVSDFMAYIARDWKFDPKDYYSSAASTIGGTCNELADGFGVSQAESDVVYLMPNAASDPSKTRMYILNDDATAFVYVGDMDIDASAFVKYANIDNSLTNPTDSDVAGAKTVMDLKAKLEGVTASEEKFVDYTSVAGCWGKEAEEVNNTSWSRAEIVLPSSAKNVRILGVAFKNSLGELSKNVANILGHYENGAWISDYIQPMDINTENVNITREYTYAIPSQSTHFRINTRYGSTLMPESSFYCYLQSGDTVGESIANLESAISESIDDSKTYTNAAVGDNVISCEAEKKYRLGPYPTTGLLAEYLSGEFSLHVIFLQHGEEALVKVSSDTDFNLVVCTTAYPNHPAIGVAYENYERFTDLRDFAKILKYDSDVYLCVMCPDSLKDVLSINKVTRIDATNYSFVKLQQVRKDLKINPDGNGDLYFTSSNAHYTYMSFIKKGSTVKIEVSSAYNNAEAFFTFGTAPKFMPPYSMSSVSEMNGFEILKRYWMRRDSFYYTATNDCWIWCAFSKDTVNVSFSVASDLNESVKSNATPTVGSMNFHLQPDLPDDENITLQTDDIYAIYDELALQHPLWLVKKDDIGVSSVGGIAIRHYEFGYQKRTMMYNYNNPETASNNKMFNDQGVNRDMRHILVDSGIHGDEKASVYGLAMAIKSILESNDDWAVYIKTNFIIDIVPVLSPDTFDANSRNIDYNDESLDPNRDYADFKLNETKAIVDLVLSVNPIAYIDCHNTNSNQYTNKKRMFLAAPKGCEYFQSVLDLSMRMSSYMSQALPASYNYPDDPKVWFLVNENEDERQATLGGFMSQLGIIAMTLESPRNLNYTSGSTKICTKRASTLMSSLVENVLPAVGSFVFK